MFRFTTIIREAVLRLAKVTFMFKHSVKLCRFILLFDDAATSSNSNIQRHNFTECFNINVTLARCSTASLMTVVNRNM